MNTLEIQSHPIGWSQREEFRWTVSTSLDAICSPQAISIFSNSALDIKPFTDQPFRNLICHALSFSVKFSPIPRHLDMPHWQFSGTFYYSMIDINSEFF